MDRTREAEGVLEGEIFGVGMMEKMAEMYPERADEATACATMEWFNIHRLEDFGDAVGVHISLEDAEKLGREGAEMVRKHSFEHVAKLTVAETPEADKMYERLSKGADTPELTPQTHEVAKLTPKAG